MEVNSDGDVAEQIFYDTVREYVVSDLAFPYTLLKYWGQTTVREATKRQAN